LLAIEGKTVLSIHNLELLFNRIDADHQKMIRNYFKNKEAEMVRFFSAVNREAGYDMMPPSPDFHEQLRASADAFRTMRYIYENRRKKITQRGISHTLLRMALEKQFCNSILNGNVHDLNLRNGLYPHP
jgi:hypothetical protein